MKKEKTGEYRNGIRINYKEYMKDQEEKSQIAQMIKTKIRLQKEQRSNGQRLSKKMREYFGVE